MADTCRYCGNAIVWARSATSKALPVDPEPAPGGNLVLEGHRVRAATADERRAGKPLWRSHFATCAPPEGAPKARAPPDASDAGEQPWPTAGTRRRFALLPQGRVKLVPPRKPLPEGTLYTCHEGDPAWTPVERGRRGPGRGPGAAPRETEGTV